MTKRIRRLMHPTDFSPASAAAFRQALAMARANRAELLLVHALAPIAPIVAEGYISPKTWDTLERSARAAAQHHLARLLGRAKRAGVRARGLVLDGEAAREIVRAARAKRTDVIVMGTHGRTGLAKLFLGSVAERVVGTAPCPVMTVRGAR